AAAARSQPTRRRQAAPAGRRTTTANCRAAAAFLVAGAGAGGLLMGAAWKKLRPRRLSILAMAMLNLIFALLAVAPLSPPLARALDDRPAAAAVADSADDAPRAELLQDHPEIVATALSSGAITLLFWGVLSWIFAGGLLGPDRFVNNCVRHGW